MWSCQGNSIFPFRFSKHTFRGFLRPCIWMRSLFQRQWNISRSFSLINNSNLMTVPAVWKAQNCLCIEKKKHKIKLTVIDTINMRLAFHVIQPDSFPIHVGNKVALRHSLFHVRKAAPSSLRVPSLLLLQHTSSSQIAQIAHDSSLTWPGPCTTATVTSLMSGKVMYKHGQDYRRTIEYEVRPKTNPIFALVNWRLRYELVKDCAWSSMWHQ